MPKEKTYNYFLDPAFVGLHPSEDQLMAEWLNNERLSRIEGNRPIMINTPGRDSVNRFKDWKAKYYD